MEFNCNLKKAKTGLTNIHATMYLNSKNMMVILSHQTKPPTFNYEHIPTGI